MTTVWKHVLKAIEQQQLMVPAGAEFLCVHEQNNQICVWYRCNPDNPKEPRTLKVRGTGHPNAEGKYLGSAHLESGSLVFHVFESEALA